MTRDWQEILAIFDEACDKCPDFGRKGKNMIYTSTNGYMFALLNKDGEIGIRLSPEEGKKFLEEHESGPYYSYGAKMREYVRIPEIMLSDTDRIAKYMQLGYEYVMTLDTK